MATSAASSGKKQIHVFHKPLCGCQRKEHITGCIHDHFTDANATSPEEARHQGTDRGQLALTYPVQLPDLHLCTICMASEMCVLLCSALSITVWHNSPGKMT